MRIPALLPTVFIASVAASPILAQTVMRVGPGTIGGANRNYYIANQPRAIIGVSTSTAATSRDTLGILVATVRPGSPAEKAGIEEGNRIASINGVNLKLAAADVGDEAMAGVMARRLQRELDKLAPGDEVDLRVVAGGQSKSLKVRTVAPADIDDGPRRMNRDERATLGINLATTGSGRDSIGVFVMGVEDGGPAAKAGIEEGSRIASINGVDLRMRRSADDEDFVIRSSPAVKLERELSKVRAGDVVDLRVYFAGQYKDIKVTTVSVGDLPRRNRTMTIRSGDAYVVPNLDKLRLDAGVVGLDIADHVRRALDEVRLGTARGLEPLRSLRFDGRFDW